MIKAGEPYILLLPQIVRGKQMLLKYDVQKLDEALNDFYNVTGVGISILREDYSPLGTKKTNNMYCRLVQSNKPGLVRCLDFNRHLLEECKETKEARFRICHAGLVEIAVPILYNGDVIGYAILGHVRPEEYPADFAELLSGLPIEAGLAEEVFRSLPVYESGKLKSIMNIASMFGRSLILENFIRPKESEHLENIRKFVNDNIDKKLTAGMISKGTYISRSTLYSILNNDLGCTVSEFICNAKIDRAKELLEKTDIPVKDISESLGFSSPAYFGKAFKENTGISPLKFRKMTLS